MLWIRRRLAVRTLLVAGMALAGVAVPKHTAEASQLDFCTFCSDDCSLLNCIADASCRPSGTCQYDEACPGHTRVYCE